MRTLRNAALCAAIAFCTAGPSAQGLGELAKRASDKPPQTAAKTYTNDDVSLAEAGAPAAAAPAVPTPEKPVAEATAVKAQQGTGAPAPAAEEKEKEKPKPPQYMIDRMAEIRVQIDALKEQLSTLESGKDGVAPLASLQTLRDKITNLQKELALFTKRAAAPVPPRR